MNHGGHQTQHATRALELHKGGPVGVEPVKNLRVNRIGCLDALFVIGVVALGRKLLVLGPVKIGEGPRHNVAVLELGLIGERLE